MDDADGQEKADAKHAFPSITIPAIVNPGSKPLFPELYFSLFADQDIEVRRARFVSTHTLTHSSVCPVRSANLGHCLVSAPRRHHRHHQHPRLQSQRRRPIPHRD